MGIGDLLRQSVANAVRFTPTGRPNLDLRSPWTVGALTPVVAHDILGASVVPMSRALAIQVPAVARCRHLLVGALAGSPLVQLDGEAVTDDQPAWLSAAPGSTAWHRMAWTVDDLYFHGWSLWAVEREDGDDDAPVVAATRVPQERWHFATDGTVLFRDSDGTDREADAASVLLIPGPHEGLLSFAAPSITTARVLEETVADRAVNPVPVTQLEETEPNQLNTDEVKALLDQWREARQRRGGAVGFTPHGIALRVHGADADSGFLIHARNASSIDIARHSSIPASMLDASNVNASLTYETTQGRALQFQDDTVALYAGPLQARLSEDDASPAGLRVAFDTSARTSATPPPATGAPRED